jgi:predicted alpha/beta-fold hydrolase
MVLHIGVRPLLLVTIAAVILAILRPVPTSAVSPDLAARFATVVRQIEALPYQPAYTPLGFDSAFPGMHVLNTFPVEDYTTGSIPGSPDSPPWPPIFKAVILHSFDGAPLFGELAMHPGQHPGIVVVHGFNTHGMLSVIRWAAMLAANGYDVLAADQRDFSYEYAAGDGYPTWLQTFGWKEAQDVLAVGAYLRHQAGVTSVGVVGFSEGAQNTVLAISHDVRHIFSAALTFSGPADQDTQIYSTAEPPNCQTPTCTYPITDALIAVVVPPYTYFDPCSVLNDAAKRYDTTAYDILAQESAMHAQTQAKVPLLNFYAADDSLVAPIDAALMAAYERGNPLQQTLEIQHGEHAYYFDRWWQQMTTLEYFHALLPGATATTTVRATVNQTPGGEPLRAQLVQYPILTRAQADAHLAPFICNTAEPPPGRL